MDTPGSLTLEQQFQKQIYFGEIDRANPEKLRELCKELIMH